MVAGLFDWWLDSGPVSSCDSCPHCSAMFDLLEHYLIAFNSSRAWLVVVQLCSVHRVDAASTCASVSDGQQSSSRLSFLLQAGFQGGVVCRSALVSVDGVSEPAQLVSVCAACFVLYSSNSRRSSVELVFNRGPAKFALYDTAVCTTRKGKCMIQLSVLQMAFAKRARCDSQAGPARQVARAMIAHLRLGRVTAQALPLSGAVAGLVN